MQTSLQSPMAIWVGIILFALITPLCWALLLNELMSALDRKRQIIGRQRSASDFFFSAGRECFIAIHLKTGETVIGFFGENSYITSFPQAGNLYIETLYFTNDDGDLEPVPNSLGMIVRSEDYHHIELIEG